MSVSDFVGTEFFAISDADTFIIIQISIVEACLNVKKTPPNFELKHMMAWNL